MSNAPTVAPEAPADAAVVPAAAPEPAVARIVSDKPRARTVELDWPVECAGKLYERVTVRRLSAREIADFVGRMAAEPDRPFRWPMCEDTDGLPVPETVLDAMDDDDALVIDEVTKGFLPQRFQASATPG